MAVTEILNWNEFKMATSANPNWKLISNSSVHTGISSYKSEVAQPAERLQQHSETMKENILIQKHCYNYTF